MTHRQKLYWQVGFLFSAEIEASVLLCNRRHDGFSPVLAPASQRVSRGGFEDC
jgi:hypothetical protein